VHYAFEYPEAGWLRLYAITQWPHPLARNVASPSLQWNAPVIAVPVRQRTDPQRCGVYLRDFVAFERTTMFEADVIHTVAQQRTWSSPEPSSGSSDADRHEQQQQRNTRFVNLLNAFRDSGGLARANEVATQFERRSGQGTQVLGDWLVRRQAIGFEWHSRLWLPLFQFNRGDLSLRPGLTETLAELVGVYNEWDLASWFAKPNPWLSEGLPADGLADSAPQVLWAARAERSAAAANSQMTL